MQDRFEIHTAPLPPLRAERRQTNNGSDGHIRGVDASTGGLIRSTLGAAAAAGAILLFAWLPAEYGIDPTGVGGVLGLTPMGEIKQQLYAEGAAEDAALASSKLAPATGSIDPAIAQRLSAIEVKLSEIAAVIGVSSVVEATPPRPAPAAAPEQKTVVPEVSPTPAEAQPAPAKPLWRDEVSYTLAPGEGVEVKLVMEKGDIAKFAWSAEGGVLNHDTHGDGGGQSVTYERGRGVPGQEGSLTAAFTGNHGWFWRNRTETPVTFKLQTGGDYEKIKAP